MYVKNILVMFFVLPGYGYNVEYFQMALLCSLTQRLSSLAITSCVFQAFYTQMFAGPEFPQLVPNQHESGDWIPIRLVQFNIPFGLVEGGNNFGNYQRLQRFSELMQISDFSWSWPFDTDWPIHIYFLIFFSAIKHVNLEKIA